MSLLESQVFEGMAGCVSQYGCKHFCRLEKHIKLNQLWRIRDVVVTPLLFCRKCEYYTFKKLKTCYCCGKPMCSAKARCSKSRRLNNKNKVRY